MLSISLRTVLMGLLLAFPAGGTAFAVGQTVFKTPEEAAGALVDAAKAQDTAALKKILGPEAADLIDSGDPTADAADRAGFAAAWQAGHSLETSADGNTVFLTLGSEDRTFPVPLVKYSEHRWRFDGTAGVEELMDRRVGRNELSAMEVCRAIGDAERDYYLMNPEKARVPHFAQKIVSSTGRRDGLYWPTAEGETPSPLGVLAAEAADEGYNKSMSSFHGYRYRILTGQGEHAGGGACDYSGDDLMFGGFAVLAFPANYGVSGVMSFMLGYDGSLYEKNLGAETADAAARITRFDPDPSWQKVEDADAEPVPGADQ